MREGVDHAVAERHDHRGQRRLAEGRNQPGVDTMPLSIIAFSISGHAIPRSSKFEGVADRAAGSDFGARNWGVAHATDW